MRHDFLLIVQASKRRFSGMTATVPDMMRSVSLVVTRTGLSTSVCIGPNQTSTSNKTKNKDLDNKKCQSKNGNVSLCIILHKLTAQRPMCTQKNGLRLLPGSDHCSCLAANPRNPNFLSLLQKSFFYRSEKFGSLTNRSKISWYVHKLHLAISFCLSQTARDHEEVKKRKPSPTSVACGSC